MLEGKKSRENTGQSKVIENYCGGKSNCKYSSSETTYTKKKSGGSGPIVKIINEDYIKDLSESEAVVLRYTS